MIVSVASPAVTVTPSPTIVESVKVTKELTPTAPVRALVNVIAVLPIETIGFGVGLPVTVRFVSNDCWSRNISS